MTPPLLRATTSRAKEFHAAFSGVGLVHDSLGNGMSSRELNHVCPIKHPQRIHRSVPAVSRDDRLRRVGTRMFAVKPCRPGAG